MGCAQFICKNQIFLEIIYKSTELLLIVQEFMV